MSEKPQILFTKPGTITAEDRTTLREANIIVIEIDNLNDYRLVSPQLDIPRDGLLQCAGDAIASSANAQTTFGKVIAEYLAKGNKP